MESEFFEYNEKVFQTFQEIIYACDMIINWNENIKDYNDYLISPDGVKNLAATCMMVESIGENIKNIDRLLPNFLNENYPEIPWRELKGVRDQIAHRYFRIDAEIVYDFVKNEIERLRKTCKIILGEE